MPSHTCGQNFGSGEMVTDHPTKPRCTLLLSLPPLPWGAEQEAAQVGVGHDRRRQHRRGWCGSKQAYATVQLHIVCCA